MRKEKNLTQKELADKIFVTDKAVSKWESGNGCPDITIILELAKVLGVDIRSILKAELSTSANAGDNLSNIKFYRCKSCSNLVCSTKK